MGCTEPSPGPSTLSVLRACGAERRIRGPEMGAEQLEHCHLPTWASGLEAVHTILLQG